MRTSTYFPLFRPGRGFVLALASVFVLGSCATGGDPSSPIPASSTAAETAQSSQVVGTVSRHDAGNRLLVLSDDTQVGSALGQGGETHVYYDAGVAVSREGQDGRIDAIKPGDRVAAMTVPGARGRLQAQNVRVLYDSMPSQEWGRYLHGLVASINARSSSIAVQQAGSMISVRIGYDEQTRVFAADGSPRSVADLKAGDEVDMVLRRSEPDDVAVRIALLR